MRVLALAQVIPYSNQDGITRKMTTTIEGIKDTGGTTIARELPQTIVKEMIVTGRGDTREGEGRRQSLAMSADQSL